MAIREQLDADLKEAMRAKDRVRLDTIRNVRATLRQRELDEGKELDEDGVLKLMRGLVKQRDEAIAQYQEGGRDDLVEQEQAEKAVLEAYLPAAPSAADVEAAVEAVIAELGATGMKQMGQVMKAAMAKLGPAADGKQVSATVKAKLSS
ncbi:MAG: GatB/YqeY domain-containing protein [Myxococcales bacterium]|nr:GatB/YqeY domain-containing protein [Myxococcales bacterium]